MTQQQIRTAVLRWDSQDARDHFEERAAIIQYEAGWSEAESEAMAYEQINKTVCQRCLFVHEGGPERCEGRAGKV